MVNYFEQTIQIVGTSFATVIGKLFAQLPYVIVGLSIALLLIIVGWIIGYFAKLLVKNILKAMKLDDWAKEHDLKTAVGGVELSSLTGSFVKWYIVLIFVTEAANYVKLASVKVFMEGIIHFAPLLYVSAVILVLGILLARFFRNKIEATNHRYKKTFANVLEWLVVFLALLVSLSSVGVNVSVLENAFLIAFGSFFVVLAIVLGLSVAFAFKDEIRGLVEEVRKNVR